MKDPTPNAPASQPLTKQRNSFLKLLSIVVLLLAIGGGWFFQQDKYVEEVLEYVLRDTGRLSRMPATVLDAMGVLPDKYESEIVKVDVRHLVSDLVCNDADYSATPLFDGKTFHVTEPMETQQSMADDRVFVMLNGANDGVYVSWNGQFECVGQAAEVAATWLGADRDVMVNGVRLYSQMGWPVHNEAELKTTKNIVHVLLDFQLWQWPGIKKGYKYVLEDGVMLTTVGMRPKVLDVEYFLTQNDADKVIELGSPYLDRSKVDGSRGGVPVPHKPHGLFAGQHVH